MTPDSPPSSPSPASSPGPASPAGWASSPTGDLPLSTLRRIATTPRAPYEGEHCEMCDEPIGDQHQHVVDLDTRALMCTCRGCYLLFATEGAHQRHRAIPERYLSFPQFRLGPGQWEQLEIPVALAFFFHNSVQDRTIAFYPGPAGATESELPLAAWQSVVADNPGLAMAAADTEAVMIRAQSQPDRPVAEALLVPIDSCYQLVGRLRSVWRGFDGGQDARESIESWFDMVRARSRPAREVS